jgi:hypothetical protein
MFVLGGRGVGKTANRLHHFQNFPPSSLLYKKDTKRLSVLTCTGLSKAGACER